jgi:hypothetical protein
MVIPVDSENGDQILKKVTWNKNRDAAVITDIMDVRFVPLLPDIDNGES